MNSEQSQITDVQYTIFNQFLQITLPIFHSWLSNNNALYRHSENQLLIICLIPQLLKYRKS